MILYLKIKVMLRVRDLSYCVGSGSKRHYILDNLNFEAKAGEIVVITGQNGSGKSSFAQIIMGIRKAQSGIILFDGKDISNLSITDRAKLGIAYSFQQPIHFKGLSVKDILQVAATGNETFLIDKKTDYEKLLGMVGLDSNQYLNREINASLSGGELKRIEIASVLARNARLMIFDEPEAGIDIWSFEKLISIFKKIRKQNPNGSIIIISHQEKIMKVADRIFVLKNGKLAQVKSILEISE